jgi:quercetin dioxygenase-like cupin family protein
MEDRRTFMALATALFPASLITLSAQAQTPAGVPSTASAPPSELARHTLTGPLAAFDALLIELRPGPGQGREHRHNGPVLGYVLEGRVRFGVNHEPERIYGVGETFFEETGALHSTWGSADPTPARVIVFMVVPKATNGAA